LARYASGKKSQAISDRSGFRYRYNDMRKEWTGALVGKDEWEPKQPQLGPFKEVSDAEALKDPRPDRIEPMVVFVGASSFPPGRQATNAVGSTGFVLVVTT
jgi:hypothetical protein